MRRSFSLPTLMAVTLAFAAGLTSADSTHAKAVTSAPAHSPTQAKPAVARIKLVDINSAGKAELKTLPGIHDAEAERIVAGRPYGSKAWLVSNKILGMDVYQGIRTRIIARQHAKFIVKPAAAGAAHSR